ncbi:hypothetical protein [Streptomyces sp. NPDC058330]|uniref:hypothetical protein n=1 Tax=Streptomyces sp. NPDC058330 TaxID=3346449 RepID=UPI0036EDCB4F
MIGAALGVLVPLPPLAGMAAGLSEATSSDVGLYLNSGVVVGITGTLVADAPCVVLVIWIERDVWLRGLLEPAVARCSAPSP